MNATYRWLKLPSKMLLRTGKQLDFLLCEDVPATLVYTGTPSTIIDPFFGVFTKKGRIECYTYMMFNTPNLLHEPKNIGTFGTIVSLLERKERKFYKFPNPVSSKEEMDQLITSGKLRAVHIQYQITLNDDSPVASFDRIEWRIRSLLEPTNKMPYVLIRFAHNGHACMAPIQHGNFVLTTVMREDDHGFSCVGRRPGNPWYSYRLETGVVKLHEADVRRCINVMTNPGRLRWRTKKDFDLGFEVQLMYQNTAIRHVPLLTANVNPEEYEASLDEIIQLVEQQDPTSAAQVISRITVPVVQGANGELTSIPLYNRTFSETRPIKNLMNTCYINAAMQLVARMDGLEHVEEADSCIPSFLLEMFQFGDEIIEPRPEFVTCFGTKINRLLPREDLIRTIKDVSKKTGATTTQIQADPVEVIDYMAREQHEINEYFIKNVNPTIRFHRQDLCIGCGNLIIPDQVDQSFCTIKVSSSSLGLQEVFDREQQNLVDIELQEVLDREQQSMSNPTTEVLLTCTTCGTQQIARESVTTFISFGNYVLLHFIIAAENGQKHLFTFKDFDTFSLKDENGNTHVFQPVAMIAHRGTIQNGHYVTAVVREDGYVYVYDDEAPPDEKKYTSFPEALEEESNEFAGGYRVRDYLYSDSLTIENEVCYHVT